MSDADDSGPDTPGTDQEEIDEDARLVGNEPKREEIDEPTQGGQQEARESYWMIKEMAAIGIVSILALVLLAFGLMQATGLVTLPDPIGSSPLAHWTVFLALALVLVAAFAWSQWRT